MSESADAPALVEGATPPAPQGSAPKRTPAGHRGAAKRRNFLLALTFLAPALVLIGALLVYPVVFTVVRSLFDQTGNEFIGRSEEHTSELQSRGHLVCRLLLEKKKTRHEILKK